LAAIEGFVAINSVLEIDLAGRANAERIGGRIIAGPGGLPDFATGATRSKGGKSVIALRSTTPNGDRSNIRPALDPAVPATIDADQIDYVVTEYGVAHIRPLTGVSRASSLIEIAHPDWKGELALSLQRSSLF
jgi:4-hydroxybutyrate CoA-transferase